jgi:hypothetical protein
VPEIDRPSWCQNPECACLTGYAGRFCVGRLPKPQPHDDLLNTHNFCLESDFMMGINDQDAYYFIRGLAAVRGDVAARKLYRPPGYQETWDFAKEGRR